MKVKEFPQNFPSPMRVFVKYFWMSRALSPAGPLQHLQAKAEAAALPICLQVEWQKHLTLTRRRQVQPLHA